MALADRTGQHAARAGARRLRRLPVLRRRSRPARPVRWADAHGDAPLAFVDPSLLVALDAQVGDSLRLGQADVHHRRRARQRARRRRHHRRDRAARLRLAIAGSRPPGCVQFGSRAEYEVVLRLPDRPERHRARAPRWRATLRRRIDPRTPIGWPRTRRAIAPPRHSAAASASTIPWPSARRRRELQAGSGARARAHGGRHGAGLHRSGRAARRFPVGDRPHRAAARRHRRGQRRPRLRRRPRSTRWPCSAAWARAAGRCSRSTCCRPAVMGLAGAAVGTALGVAIQLALPGAVQEFLPLDVAPTLEWRAIALGLGIGVWVALVFALRPLLALRRVSPLQALRRATDDRRAAARVERSGPPRRGRAAGGEHHRHRRGAHGRAARRPRRVASASRWPWSCCGRRPRVLIRVARTQCARGLAVRPAPGRRQPLPPRQPDARGHAGARLRRVPALHRVPRAGQPAAPLRGRRRASRGNLLFFDVQDDQVDALDSLVSAGGQPIVERTPIVTMRLAGINGANVQRLLNDTTVDRPRWALRREYRSSYRDSLSGVGGARERARGRAMPAEREAAPRPRRPVRGVARGGAGRRHGRDAR